MIKTEEYIYSGIHTFMSSPYVSLEDSAKYDVTVLGVPIDFGSSYRLGSKYGPRDIREYSMLDRVAKGKYYDLDSETWIQSDDLSICDIGDLNIWPTDPERNSKELIHTVSAIRKSSLPVILGGDHSITYSNFKGCIDTLRNKKVGILHFDAHLDTEGEYLPSLPKIWHGNPFSALIQEGSLEGKRLVTVGPRGRISEEAYKYTRDKGIHLFTATQVNKLGIKKVIEQIKEIFSIDTDYIFLTIDIDCLDISTAPGTGTPKYGGLAVQDLINALISLKELPVIGVDMVEVNPKFDSTGSTAIIAGELLYNFLSFGLNKNLQPQKDE